MQAAGTRAVPARTSPAVRALLRARLRAGSASARCRAASASAQARRTRRASSASSARETGLLAKGTQQVDGVAPLGLHEQGQLLAERRPLWRAQQGEGEQRQGRWLRKSGKASTMSSFRDGG